MGFKTVVLLLIISIFSISCSSIDFTIQNEINRDYSTFNYLGERHISKIILLNGEEIETEYVFAKNDSLFYCIEADTLSLPLTTIERVEITQTGKKIASGLLAGTSSFLVLMLAVGLAIGGDGFGIIVAIPVGIAFGVGGFIIGLNNGGDTTYIFNDKAQYEQYEYYKSRSE